MPFTFSHPAAILPFRYLPKRWTSLTGLIIGSMAPDFEYFIRMRGISTFSHSWGGLFWFDLPLSVALAFIYHLIVRNELIDHLPVFLKRHLITFKKFDWVNYFKKNYMIVIVSILIGGCTHLLWDGLTHKHGLFVKKNGWFDQAFVIDGYIMPRYKMLQHLSSIIGLLIVLFALMKLPAEKNLTDKKPIFHYWLFVSLIMLTITVVRLFFAVGNEWKRFDMIIVTLVSGFLIGLIVTPKLTALLT
jgi:hypothetical protein